MFPLPLPCSPSASTLYEQWTGGFVVASFRLLTALAVTTLTPFGHHMALPMEGSLFASSTRADEHGDL